MTLSRTSTALYLGLVFCSGAALGALAHRFYTASEVSAKVTPPPDRWRQQYMEEMQTRLKLRPDQVTRLNILLDETRSRVRETYGRLRPEIDEIKRQQYERVKEMLDEGQRVEYEQLRKERDQREKQQGRGPGPGI
jgi:hypothetical protein